MNTKPYRHLELAKRVERSHTTGVRFLHSLRSVGMTFIIFISLFFSQTVFVHAQSSITAIPPRLILSTDPGKTLTAELKVRNDSDVSQIYTVTVDDFVVVDTIGTPIPVSSSVNSRWSLKNWITAPKTVPVDAKGTQIVRITVRVPVSALAGGHYAMITYMPNGDIKPGELKKTASLIGQRVGSLIYVTVSGDITENASIIKFTTPKFLEQGPVEFTGTIENISDIHINPKGSITISNPLNSKVAELPLEAGNIFPETIRDFSSTWNNKWGWGRYKADLNLAYGTTGALLSATIFFWLFPIRLVIYSLIAIISVLLVVVLLGKRSKKHQEVLEKEVAELKRELETLEEKK